jgi:hypothetical protein
MSSFQPLLSTKYPLLKTLQSQEAKGQRERDPLQKANPTANSEKLEVSDTEEETVEEENLEEKSIVCKRTPSRRK